MTTKLPKRKSHLCNCRPISSGKKMMANYFSHGASNRP